MRLRLSPAGSRALLTLLDIAVTVFAGVALLIGLGAHGRFTVGGVPVVAVSSVRPFLFAAALLLARLVVGGRAPLLPSLRNPALQRRFSAEREWLARTVRMSRTDHYFALAAVTASLLWLTPHLLHVRRVPDPGDPIFSAWRLARLAHQLTHDPLHLFDGNTFYPEPYTLTYSDATLLEGIVATPFIVAGLDPLVVSNALFLAAFPLCALAFFYTGWRLTGDPGAGLVAGILGALYPFHTEHYSHFELQFFCFVPLAVLALLRLLAAPDVRRGLMLGGMIALQWLTCMYFGMMLMVFLLPVALFAIVGWRVVSGKNLLLSLGVSAALVAIGVSILAVPYLRSRDVRGERKPDIVTFYSALPSDYGRPHGRLASYRWVSRRGNMPERELFPGTTPIALALVGMVPPLGLPAMATIGATALAFDGSRGNHGLIYDDLFRYVMPFRGMRVPARFSAFVGCGLVLLSAFGARRLLHLAPGARARTAVAVVLAAAVLIDLRPALRVRDYPVAIPPIYSSVTPDMVLAEFPIGQDFDYMYFSTFHWARLINGYSGFVPESYIRLYADLARDFPSAAAVETLRQHGATHITVNCAMYRWRRGECESVLDKVANIPTLTLVASGRWEGDTTLLYRIR